MCFNYVTYECEVQKKVLSCMMTLSLIYPKRGWTYCYEYFSKLPIIRNITQEENFDKWQLCDFSTEKEHTALPGRSAPFPRPNQLPSFGLISQESGAEALWGPRARIPYNLMNSFFISVLQPTPNTSSASRSTCKPRTVWRSLVLGWGPLL